MRHQDALEFCRWIAAASSAGLPTETREAARYEAVGLRLRQDEGRPSRWPRIRLALFYFRLPERESEEGSGEESVAAGKGLTLAVWLAAGAGRTYHRLIGLR